MSGRKSAEVAAVLKQGESVRKLTDEIYSKEIMVHYEKYLACLKSETEIKNYAEDTTINLDDAAQEMFGDKSNSAMENFRDLKKFLSGQIILDNGKVLTENLVKLDKKLAAADAEAESIRNAIRNKNWYCDAEYSRAQDLLRTYENLRSERVNLERRMKKLLTAESQNLSSMQVKAEQLKNLVEQIKSMNDTAKKRREANAFRNELHGALNSIDAQSAKKFLASDFDALQKNIANTIAANDEKILSVFQKNYTAIVDFKNKLTECIALWHKQKNDAETLFAQMEHTASESFIDPVDHYNGEKNGRQINLFDYLKIYGGKNLSREYFNRHKKAAELIEREKFLESMSVINSAIELVENARQESLKLQEVMLKKIELAGAIQDVMEDLRYDTDLQIINENPNDGFKITCNVGDEMIDFRHIDIDEAGKIVVDIDHHEGKGAHCVNSWGDISKRLNEVGIPITEVRTADGTSVLHHEKKVADNSAQRIVSI